MEEELDRTELREQKERYRFVDRIEFADGATSKKRLYRCRVHLSTRKNGKNLPSG